MFFAVPRFTTVVVDGVVKHPDREGYIRMLPSYWEKIQSAIRNLDFEAQEYVCQLCAQYKFEIDPKVANSYKYRRKFLVKTERHLKQLIKWLDEGPDLESLANAVRLAHRPLGDRLSLLEITGLSSEDHYFTRNGLQDPGRPILALMESINALATFLEKERGFLKSESGRTKALWKTKPGLRKGRMQYLLERIFRERSKPKATKRVAHRRMCFVFRQLTGRKLRFNPDKKILSSNIQSNR